MKQREKRNIRRRRAPSESARRADIAAVAGQLRFHRAAFRLKEVEKFAQQVRVRVQRVAARMRGRGGRRDFRANARRNAACDFQDVIFRSGWRGSGGWKVHRRSGRAQGRRSLRRSGRKGLAGVHNADDGRVNCGPAAVRGGGGRGPTLLNDQRQVTLAGVSAVQGQKRRADGRSVRRDRLDEEQASADVPLIFLRGNRVADDARKNHEKNNENQAGEDGLRTMPQKTAERECLGLEMRR
jgi:hypothetical protein